MQICNSQSFRNRREGQGFSLVLQLIGPASDVTFSFFGQLIQPGVGRKLSFLAEVGLELPGARNEITFAAQQELLCLPFGFVNDRRQLPRQPPGLPCSRRMRTASSIMFRMIRRSAD